MSRRRLLSKKKSGTYLFDVYGVGRYGFSFRQLSSNATNCIRVRRSSDNAEQDIEFSEGQLDEVSLLAFVGPGNDGHVVTWYNQGSMAFNFQNTTGDNEPYIVYAGSVVKKGGLPTITCGTNRWLKIETIGLFLPSTFSAFFVAELNSVNQYLIRGVTSTGEGHFFRRWTTSGVWFRHSGTQAQFTAYPPANTPASMVFHRYNATNCEFVLNGVSDGDKPMSDSWSTTDAILRYSNSRIFEIVYYSGDKRNDSTQIISNQNDFYNTH